MFMVEAPQQTGILSLYNIFSITIIDSSFLPITSTEILLTIVVNDSSKFFKSLYALFSFFQFETFLSLCVAYI